MNFGFLKRERKSESLKFDLELWAMELCMIRSQGSLYVLGGQEGQRRQAFRRMSCHLQRVVLHERMMNL